MPAPVPVLLMNYSLTHGGTERQIAATALSLDRRQFTPHVAYVKPGFRAEELERAGVPLLQLPLNSYVNGSAWRSAVQLRRYLRDHQIRLVHAFDHSIAIFGVPVSSLVSSAAVLSSQRYHFPLIPRKHLWLLKLAHRMARGIVVNSEAVRRHMEEHGYDRERIHVCHNGIDAGQFACEPRQRIAGLEDAALVVGVVCVLRPEKNLGMLLEAFASVARGRAGVRLLIAGSGPERERLESQAQRLEIGSQCLFLPSAASVAECLRSIDVFVHPSASEGMPNAVMEAMSCGCCVLSSNVGGSPEAVGAAGMLFAPQDLEMLVGQLRTVLEDRPLRERLGRSAAERIRAEFTMERAARRMEEIYRQHLGEVKS